MSNTVLPALAGLKYPASRMPIWSGKVQTAVSGKETRLNYWSTPRYRWTIGYEVLREGAGSGATDLQQLVGFYNARAGQYDDWLFTDPDDNTVSTQLFATGDGVTNQFQLARTYGGFSEPVRAVNTITNVTISDYQGVQSITAVAHLNAVLWSEQFASLWGFNSTAFVTSNTTVAPNGATTADTIDFSGNVGASCYSDSALAVANSSTYTFSIWLKGTAGQTVTIGLFASVAGGATSAAVTLTASWVRYSISLTTAASGTSGVARATLSRSSGTALQFQAWGAQVEPGATVSRYLPTTGSATTAADYSVDGYGVVTLPTPLSIGGTLAWTGTFYWRVRWDDMDFALEKMMAGLWSSADLTFTSLK